MADDKKILIHLQKKHACAFNLLYTAYYPVVEKFILANHGSKEDAEDIFQEALLVLDKNVGRKDFALTSSLKTYVYAISRNLWLKALRDKKQLSSLDKQPEIEAYDEEAEALEQYVDSLVAAIPSHCREMVDYIYYQNIPVDKVAKKMGYRNAHTASNIKYKCLQQLKEAFARRP